jgi:hypothetical protein
MVDQSIRRAWVKLANWSKFDMIDRSKDVRQLLRPISEEFNDSLAIYTYSLFKS